VWNFAEGMDNMTTPSTTSSTTTERPPVPASAAVALNAWAVNLVASAAVVAVVFFRSF
uniref:C-type cytochrome biogenesis protein CcsB n=1 Tax=Globodera pallida TaxID=36090 RepID=A0A183CTK0_GLOPA